VKHKTLKELLLEKNTLGESPDRVENMGNPSRDAFLNNLQRQLFFQILPAYILDINFQYLDWNPAFDEIIARPLGFQRGMHGSALIARLANCDEVYERSMRVFHPGNHPLVDTEPLLLKSDRYGLIRFHKMAAQILDDRGQMIAWALTLNISGADNLEQLWKDIESRVQSETAYLQYVSARDRLLANHPEGVALRNRLAQAAATAPRTLELGAGFGELTKQLLRGPETVPPHQVFTHEDNAGLLAILERSVVAAAPTLSIVREPVDQLRDYPTDFFDAVVSWDGLWRREDSAALIGNLSRVIRRQGTLAIAVRLESSSEALCKSLSSRRESPTGQSPELNEVAEINLERSTKILDAKVARPSSTELGRLVDRAGFQIQELDSTFLGGTFALLIATKR
jgi:SAM-dependent methyltransferase